MKSTTVAPLGDTVPVVIVVFVFTRTALPPPVVEPLISTVIVEVASGVGRGLPLVPSVFIFTKKYLPAGTVPEMSLVLFQKLPAAEAY